MLTLYDSRLSLNCYKVRLLLALLQVPYARQAVDLRLGEHRTPAMLARNPFGQVPALDIGSAVLRDSSAMLVWLARTHDVGGHWMPADPGQEAVVNAWLHATAFELRLGPYEARLRKHFPSLCVAGDAVGPNTERALSLFEARLQGRDWLALDHPTVADIAAYPSLAHCGDGDVSLAGCPAIQAWLQRVQALPGYVGLLA
jgi:glutathione S-transferase